MEMEAVPVPWSPHADFGIQGQFNEGRLHLHCPGLLPDQEFQMNVITVRAHPAHPVEWRREEGGDGGL